MMGCLITLQGTVTRLSEIEHKLKSATFISTLCKELIPNIQQEFKFTKPVKCIGQQCTNRNSWEIKPETCHFEDWQKLRFVNKSME